MDLVPKYLLYRLFLNKDDSDSNRKYNLSSIRTFLNGSLYDGFADEIKSDMATQSFQFSTNSASLINDKIKCPSITEVGCCSSDVPLDYFGYPDYYHDEIYPIFGESQQTKNALAIYNYENGQVPRPYPIRNLFTKYGGCIGCISSIGRYGYSGLNNYFDIIGIIRFGKSN